MKKVSIIILLTALILGAFTACNGDVFSDLMPKDDPEPTPKRTITLEIPSTWTNYSFDESDTSVKTKELEIPENCKTWADYLEEVTDTKVYDTYHSKYFTLMKKDGKVFFCWYYESEDIYQAAFGLELDDSKVGPPPETVNASADIVIGGTYTLTSSPT